MTMVACLVAVLVVITFSLGGRDGELRLGGGWELGDCLDWLGDRPASQSREGSAPYSSRIPEGFGVS